MSRQINQTIKIGAIPVTEVLVDYCAAVQLLTKETQKFIGYLTLLLAKRQSERQAYTVAEFYSLILEVARRVSLEQSNDDEAMWYWIESLPEIIKDSKEPGAAEFARELRKFIPRHRKRIQ